jgi:hypothetical protein
MPGHVAASTTAPVLAPLEPEAAAPDAPLDDPELEPDEDPLLEPLFDDPLFDDPLFDDPLFDDPLFEPLLEPLFDDPELPLDTVVPGVLEAQAPCRVTILNALSEPSTLQR